MITFDLGPPQKPITEERIEEMIRWVPRRFRLCDFDRPLKQPRELGDWQEDWNLIFPFRETFVPAFEEMCSFPDHIPFNSKGTAYYTFLKDVSGKDIPAVKEWLEKVSGYVALRDALALSFAIDYDREGGNPENEHTHIGSLRQKAKTYGKPASPETHYAADALVEACVEAVNTLTCYSSMSCIVGIPPSDPDKPFDLPEYLAHGMSDKLGKPDKSKAVRTTRARPPSKQARLEDKLSSVKGTIEVDGSEVRDDIVLLVDDLYQSGVTMNYTAMLLLAAGAKKVFGLSCEKTCSNDDNVSRCKG